MLWVDFDGLGNSDLIARVGKALTRTRCRWKSLNVNQRPKVEQFDTYSLWCCARSTPGEARASTR